jgi:hypothetical protein
MFPSSAHVACHPSTLRLPSTVVTSPTSLDSRP